MSFDPQRLFELLPVIYQVRDAEGAGGSKDVLRSLIDVIGGQVAVLEEDLAQLYDDQFIETCAEWVAPYIGDLIGYRTLYSRTEKIGSPRAEVANTIAYRRRKGTASMLEQLARDVTEWDARAVEFFQLLATTQYMNHIRRSNIGWVNMRASQVLAAITTPFDTAAHTAEVRRIARRRGRYNIPNVGISAWRIHDYPLSRSPAVKLVPADANDRRYFFSPTGNNAPLYNRAIAEDTITHIAERENVPMPITRRELWDSLETYYPSSLSVTVDGTPLPASAVAASDLSDVAGGWAYTAPDKVLIDPVLGRLSLPAALSVNGQPVNLRNPLVTFQYGFSGDYGGGEYSRFANLSADIAPIVTVSAPAKIGPALTGLPASGVVEVSDNGRYVESLGITAPAGARIELRGAEGVRPTLVLGGPLEIDLDADSEVTLHGLLIVGDVVRVPASSTGGRIRLRHCTLVPGIALNVDGTPQQPTEPSLVVESGLVSVEIDHCITGGVRAHEDASVRIIDSIVDATDQTGVAYAALDDEAEGGTLEVVRSTIIGKIHARILSLVSNSILAARLAETDTWDYPVWAERRQEGCARFSYIPPGARLPRRYRCQPASSADAARIQPQFSAMRYGDPSYCQLSTRCALEIRTGAEDESEMGVFHDLFGPQRETNVAVRLEEYLRFGLEAGLFYAS
jgi:hypothetical protein